MTFPAFYHPEKAGTQFTPNTLAAVEAGHSAGLTPSAQDSTKIALLLIDMQVDFIHADGALSVPGAIDDTRRVIEWIFNNAARLTTIVASLDSHVPIQIFSSAWWTDAGGQHPAPFTVISAQQVRDGVWTPLYDVEWSKLYVNALEEKSKKQLMIWPYHTLIGTVGQSLTPALYEAIAYHASARQSQPVFVTKGTIANTENYSIFELEVKRDDLPAGGLNVDLLESLAGYDRIYVAGEAKSHCVLETVNSMMRYFAGRPDVIRKIRLMKDCMSSVAHPEIDFDKLADDALQGLAAQGLIMTTSNSGLS